MLTKASAASIQEWLSSPADTERAVQNVLEAVHRNELEKLSRLKGKTIALAAAGLITTGHTNDINRTVRCLSSLPEALSVFMNTAALVTSHLLHNKRAHQRIITIDEMCPEIQDALESGAHMFACKLASNLLEKDPDALARRVLEVSGKFGRYSQVHQGICMGLEVGVASSLRRGTQAETQRVSALSAALHKYTPDVLDKSARATCTREICKELLSSVWAGVATCLNKLCENRKTSKAENLAQLFSDSKNYVELAEAIEDMGTYDAMKENEYERLCGVTRRSTFSSIRTFLKRGDDTEVCAFVCSAVHHEIFHPLIDAVLGDIVVKFRNGPMQEQKLLRDMYKAVKKMDETHYLHEKRLWETIIMQEGLQTLLYQEKGLYQNIFPIRSQPC